MKKIVSAKLNLGLVVKGRYPNGYHDLEMVMVPLEFFDQIELEESKEMSLISNQSWVPFDQSNTMMKAIKLMHEQYHTPEHFKITLEKNIPTQAGLAGGSADGACVINMLNEMYQLGMSDEDKIKIGLQIGADVPFCLFERPAIVSGIGEKVSFIDVTCDFYILLIKPDFGISTPTLFNLLDLSSCNTLSIETLVQGLTSNKYNLVVKGLVNDLQNTANKINSKISEIVKELMDYGFDNACMTGSGSVVYGITQDKELLKRAQTYFSKRYPLVKKTKIFFKK